MMGRAALCAFAAALSAWPGLFAGSQELLVPPACAHAVLLDPSVLPRLHMDKSARRPLLVSDRHLVAREIDLNVPFRVQIVKSDDPKRADAFEFMNIVQDENETLVVTFRFPPEGLVGRARLKQGKAVCAVLDRDIYEKGAP
jgi:hypothetical protein